MSVTAQTIIDSVQSILIDDTGDRWSEAELLHYLNLAQTQIVLSKPDSNVSVSSVPLASGTRQDLPSDAYQLVSVVKNMGSDGETPGRAISIVSRGDLDAQDPDWHTSESSTIDHYVYDDRDPKHFYIYPGQTDTPGYAEIIYSALPAALTSVASNINIGDEYEGPIMDYILARAFMKDSDNTAYQNRAITHINAFMQAIGSQDRIELVNSPNVIENVVTPS